MLAQRACVIHGDGETSRDFCYIANAVQANLRAALTDDRAAIGQIFNIAVGSRTTLGELHAVLGAAMAQEVPGLRLVPVQYGPFRPGDVRHSQADIGKARRLLGYQPTHDVRAGLRETAVWYARGPSGPWP